MKNIIKKMCSRCGNEFETISGKGEKKFCSSFCSHSRKQTEETKNKLSLTMKNSEKAVLSRLNNVNFKKLDEKYLINKICPICKKQFKVFPSENQRIFCSKDCYNKDTGLEFHKSGTGGLREGSGRSKSG
jgi:endogenous inhibitor of DNA gyrase (YacG/DUF329 family)